VDYSADFKLYLTSRLPNPHYVPEICIRATVINFTVTPGGLEEQLLAEAVRGRSEKDGKERDESEVGEATGTRCSPCCAASLCLVAMSTLSSLPSLPPCPLALSPAPPLRLRRCASRGLNLRRSATASSSSSPRTLMTSSEQRARSSSCLPLVCLSATGKCSCSPTSPRAHHVGTRARGCYAVTGSILDDESVIKALDEGRAVAAAAKARVEQAEQTAAKIATARDQYRGQPWGALRGGATGPGDMGTRAHCCFPALRCSGSRARLRVVFCGR